MQAAMHVPSARKRSWSALDMQHHGMALSSVHGSSAAYVPPFPPLPPL
eukprot:CAMPEP_0173391808 /NCGR_PEP_ID=MMETSP1356-20130122/18601_1 /TAXON_ID=77927 ORGANISM="Hemiselmis virescens, Strain PCC157" /NCGR_SAMPLE_ID=MMETSP1356 /ASSEMBLY_ACC=CAM_ASM_000847 /LENGTH=47 /DNA_ID= /DNA_START= /DNA_END= /DNA_ORIENTATION=